MDVNKLRQEAQKLTGKAEAYVKDHHDQLEAGVTKVEKFAKSKSKTPKREAQIDKVAGRVRNMIPSDDKPGKAQKKAAPKAAKPEEGKPGPSGLG